MLWKAILMILEESTGKDCWCWNPRHKRAEHLVWDEQGRAPGALGSVWEQLHGTGQPAIGRWAISAAFPLLWQPLSRLTPAVGPSFPCLQTQGPATHWTLPRASCSPMCQGPKGKVLCWTRLSLISPSSHASATAAPGTAGEDTGIMAPMDIPKVCGKALHV